MAPLKFEEHIREKLEQRKLQPSENAWQKLNNQLDNDSTKKNSKVFWWLGIAASFVGVLLVVSILMNSNNENTTPSILVDTEKVDVIIKNDEQTDLNSLNEKASETTINNKEETQENSNATVEQPKVKRPSLLKQKLNKEQTKLVPVETNEAVANSETKTIKVNEIKALTLQEKAVETVVAEIKKLQEQNKSSLDSELDALLNEAQQEIAMEKLYKEAIKSVDAEALLQGVEQDMDVSFRDRVFKALKDSYKTVRTAVAERNN